MPARFALSLTIACVVSTLGILVAAVTSAHAAVRLDGRDCPLPTAVVPWHYVPDVCYILPRGDSVTIGRSVTELDVWSANGRTHLSQAADTYAGGKPLAWRTCPQWGYDARGYSVGWVTCNRDLFNYGRAVIAYGWKG
jgi:hypothetical protein